MPLGKSGVFFHFLGCDRRIFRVRLEPYFALKVFVEELTLVFHLFNILCTLFKRCGVGFYSKAMGFKLIREPSIVWKVYCGRIPICNSILPVETKDRSLCVWNISLLSEICPEMHALAKIAEMAINRQNREILNKNSNEMAKGPFRKWRFWRLPFVVFRYI